MYNEDPAFIQIQFNQLLGCHEEKYFGDSYSNSCNP